MLGEDACAATGVCVCVYENREYIRRDGGIWFHKVAEMRLRIRCGKNVTTNYVRTPAAGALNCTSNNDSYVRMKKVDFSKCARSPSLPAPLQGTRKECAVVYTWPKSRWRLDRLHCVHMVHRKIRGWCCDFEYLRSVPRR